MLLLWFQTVQLVLHTSKNRDSGSSALFFCSATKSNKLIRFQNVVLTIQAMLSCGIEYMSIMGFHLVFLLVLNFR